MIVVEPVKITDSAFNDSQSNVPENDHPIYNPATAYDAGALVTMQTGVHKNFECLIGNTNKNPSTNPLNDSQLPFWLSLGATNRWAMFDEVIGNQTSNTTSITFQLTPGQVINTIGLLNVVGSSVIIVATEPIDGEYYNETLSLIGSENIFDGYSYCFNPFITTPDIVALNIPPFLDSVINVTISGSGTVKLGQFVYGEEFNLGESLTGARPRIESYSIVNTDSFGRTTVIPRANRKLLTIDTAVERFRINSITRKMSEIIDQPSLWVGSDTNSSLIVYGILGEYAPEFGAEGSTSFINYEIKGLT